MEWLRTIAIIDWIRTIAIWVFIVFVIISEVVDKRELNRKNLRLVRCKDCKWWKSHYCNVVWRATREDEFCCWGERKGNG